MTNTPPPFTSKSTDTASEIVDVEVGVVAGAPHEAALPAIEQKPRISFAYWAVAIGCGIVLWGLLFAFVL
ncbi:hypothetical protein [Sphingomonas sp. KC8]|uniref:hypothetical protein n=1 Tax=Sphingomonas sp. KC8 TaxID=1030157 RepID=UPI0002489B7B|nr:hypothetical protein [Sphingomonas sp. KC8]ARS26155.1 hypothetical protein KC8_02465 [Sphingomonas sp. KC8]